MHFKHAAALSVLLLLAACTPAASLTASSTSTSATDTAGPGTATASAPSTSDATMPGKGSASPTPTPDASTVRATDAPTATGAAPTATASAAPSKPTAPVQHVNVNCATAKCVALTFDDGPGPYEDQVLTTLQQKGVPATFFLVGSEIQGHAASVRRAQKLGMSLGTHSWSHAQLTKLSGNTLEEEIVRPVDVLAAVTGYTPMLMRPPYGAQNADVLARAKAAGQTVIQWNVDTEDWKNRSVSITTQRALAARPGSIILMHETHPSTVKALSGIITGLQQKGYTLVTVNQLMGDTHHAGG
ncbi:polysaccharide deacetylase family protein [Neoactinobaculum massilliense]|uniref:polysaccharide deacetylase family protein n=1 Tax=Neoactinobaculum massilliense TaxID=2364794 RepID=UPI000F52AAEA|nr:polysaccharide deacetylase family protein [Neoactinobaculum massilliense]